MFINKFYLPENDRLVFFLLILFPFFLIFGNLFINIFFIIFSLIAILNFKNNIKFYDSKIFYLLLVFLICLSLSTIASVDFVNSLPRLIKFVLIILFIKELTITIHNKYNFFEKIVNCWIFIFLVTSIDIIFELVFGFNTLGFVSYIPGRISSFFGDELVVGSFYHFFSLIVISSLVTKKFPKPYLFITLFLVIILSFMIGERANFIRLFISILIMFFLIIEISFLKKIISTVLIFITLILVTYNNFDLKIRYYNQMINLYSIDGLKKYFKGSQYGAHQNTAYQIFKDNYFFGIGLKNFRDESKKKIYENTEYKKTNWRQATHPHQIHLELLSETGLLGYLSFLTLIIYSLFFSMKNYLKKKNLYQLSTIIFLITSLIPVIPSGSLFSTFYGGIFWFNFGLMISLNSYFNTKS